MGWLEQFNELRTKSGMSLDELSASSGVPKGTLSKITSGVTKNPSIETMKALVHTMGYTLDDLDKKEKTVTVDSDDLDPLDIEFISLVKQLSDQDKAMFLDLIKAIVQMRGQ